VTTCTVIVGYQRFGRPSSGWRKWAT